MARRKAKDATVLAVVSDLHLNSTVALPPGLSFPLDDGGMVQPSKAQQWLWSAWLDFWKLAAATCKRERADLWVVCNGDLVDGNHHGTGQIYTVNEVTQARMATAVLDDVAQQAAHLFVIRGTGVHVGTSGCWDEKIAEDLGATPDPLLVVDGKPAAWSWWHLPLEVRGVRFDIAHHTTRGGREWTRGNAAARLAAETLMVYAREGRRPPDVVIRSHVHNYEDSGRNQPVFGVISPCWQLQTEYGAKIAAGKPPSIGGLLFTCREGRYTFEPVLYPLKGKEFYRGPIAA